MINRMIDYMETNKRVSTPILLVITLLLVGVFVWRQVTMWAVLLNTPHISFGYTLLFDLYLGSTVLFVLMPFALTYKHNSGKSCRSRDKFTQDSKTDAVRWDTQARHDYSIAKDKIDHTSDDSD